MNKGIQTRTAVLEQAAMLASVYGGGEIPPAAFFKAFAAGALGC